MTRYVTTLSLSVEFDASDDDDATRVAEQIADTLSIPTPRGRNAELTNVEVSSEGVPV